MIGRSYKNDEFDWSFLFRDCIMISTYQKLLYITNFGLLLIIILQILLVT